jgi:NAD(P)-dependent dehydrogenase (short-subunit alcohol dehydrogenase family)
VAGTAAMIRAAGATAIAVRVDHTDEKQVAALFRRVLRAHRRLDVVVDSVAGEDPVMKQYGYLWDADTTRADAIFRQGITSHIITAKHAARAMMPARRGLIVQITENDMIGAGANPMAHAAKVAQKVLPLAWAAELAPHGITTVAVTPGFLRSETMLEHFGVSEQNWRDAGQTDANFLASESPLFVGRAIAALAADPDLQRRTGMLYGSWELARDYGVSDYDGRRPDWGGHAIDFTTLPPAWVDTMRTGAALEIRWLTALAARVRRFKARIPSSRLR